MLAIDNPLGGRLPLLDADALGRDQQKLYERIDSILIRWAEAGAVQAKNRIWRVPRSVQSAARRHGNYPSLLEWMRADSDHTSLNKRVHEVVILSIGARRISL